MRPAVYATSVQVQVGDTILVGPVDLTVGAGDWVNVIGPNGAGKSTLLRAVAGVTPAAGRIELDGIPLADLGRKRRSRHVGYLPQIRALPSGMTVEQYALLGRSPHLGHFRAEAAHDLEAVDTALSRLDLTKLADRPLDTLSGGEWQRVGLARAIAQEPRLLLLDEPTSALDIGHQQEVLELIDRLRSELGLTVISTMHDLTLAAQYGEHIVLIAGGRVIASGPPVQVLTGPHLATHYGAKVDVVRHQGNLVVIPLRNDKESPHA